MTSRKAIVAAVLFVLAPAVHATDIAWHFKADAPATWTNKNYERKGVVDFKTEEQGTYVAFGANRNAVGLVTPSVSQYVFRFSDLSTITAKVEGTFDDSTQMSQGTAEFINGTGRFEGITGKATMVARLSNKILEGDWVGSYSLPAK